jgi:hypothetical protein
VETKRILESLEMLEVWENEDVGSVKEWKTMVMRMMNVHEEMKWKRSMLVQVGGKGSKTTLARYMRIKTELREEWFLSLNKIWVKRWVRMRGGVSEIEVSKGRRRGGKKKLRRDQRKCCWCKEGAVEDDEHFWGRCEKWKEWRMRMWKKVEDYDVVMMRKVSGWGEEKRMDWLMKGGQGIMRECVLKEMMRWLRERERLGRGKDGSEKWGKKEKRQKTKKKEKRQKTKTKEKRQTTTKNEDVSVISETERKQRMDICKAFTYMQTYVNTYKAYMK